MTNSKKEIWTTLIQMTRAMVPSKIWRLVRSLVDLMMMKTRTETMTKMRMQKRRPKALSILMQSANAMPRGRKS